HRAAEDAELIGHVSGEDRRSAGDVDVIPWIINAQRRAGEVVRVEPVAETQAQLQIFVEVRADADESREARDVELPIARAVDAGVELMLDAHTDSEPQHAAVSGWRLRSHRRAASRRRRGLTGRQRRHPQRPNHPDRYTSPW